MKKTIAKIITISDLVQWHEKEELEISPKYQRNSVWNDNAKAYLIDTIIRGLPIPPIFMRQQVDVNTKTTHREIIDGQQRVRAIIEFVVSEDFSIKKSHNKDYGGMFYSDLDQEVQESILEYEVLSEVVTEKDDSVVYDMFARLNSNNIVLNKQEVRNSRFWGEFKVLVYDLSSKYRDFFLYNKLFGDNDFARMRDSDLINSMVNLIINGVVNETPSSIDNLYQEYDKNFEEIDSIEEKFSTTMEILEKIYKYLNGNTGCFSNKNYCFTLFSVIFNQLYGINNESFERLKLLSFENIENNMNLLNKAVSQFIIDYDNNIEDKNNQYGFYAEYNEFAKNHKSRTTSKAERTYRIKFLNNSIIGNIEDASK